MLVLHLLHFALESLLVLALLEELLVQVREPLLVLAVPAVHDLHLVLLPAHRLQVLTPLALPDPPFLLLDLLLVTQHVPALALLLFQPLSLLLELQLQLLQSLFVVQLVLFVLNLSQLRPLALTFQPVRGRFHKL